MPLKMEVFNPIFLVCKRFTDDLFVKNILDDLAYNISPFNMICNTKTITYYLWCCPNNIHIPTCKRSNKSRGLDVRDKLGDSVPVFTWKIPSVMDSNIDTFDVYKSVYDIICKCNPPGCIKEPSILDNSYTNWCVIRKKHVQIALLEMFILDMSKHYNINSLQYVLSIQCFLILKCLTSSDIVFDCKIKDIKNISFNFYRLNCRSLLLKNNPNFYYRSSSRRVKM